MSFIKCYHTDDSTSEVFVNLSLVEVVYIDPVPGEKLYNVKIRVGGVEYNMLNELVDNGKAANALLQVTGLKGK
ncbi:MAG: hypothetical protein WBM70_09140 [Sulfurovum sp.]|jgi:hypothetical protein|uniref:hypothetical protein n=1 Tax=Sulfurovum sp. TaxID=1969726 RepID=UPI003C73877F